MGLSNTEAHGEVTLLEVRRISSRGQVWGYTLEMRATRIGGVVIGGTVPHPRWPIYCTCWLTSLASSNIEMDVFPPKMGASIASALIWRLFWASCRLCALM